MRSVERAVYLGKSADLEIGAPAGLETGAPVGRRSGGTIRAMRIVTLFLLVLLGLPLSAQLLDTEVWVGTLDTKEGRFAISDWKNVSQQHPGYDNQPAFFPNGVSLVY